MLLHNVHCMLNCCLSDCTVECSFFADICRHTARINFRLFSFYTSNIHELKAKHRDTVYPVARWATVRSLVLGRFGSFGQPKIKC